MDTEHEPYRNWKINISTLLEWRKEPKENKNYKDTYNNRNECNPEICMPT